MKGDYKIKGGLKLSLDAVNTSISKDTFKVESLAYTGTESDSKPLDVKGNVLINLVEDDLYHLPKTIFKNEMANGTFIKGLNFVTSNASSVLILTDDSNFSIPSVSGVEVAVVDKKYPIVKSIYKGLSKSKKTYDLVLSLQEVCKLGGLNDHYILLAGNGFKEQLVIKTTIGLPISEILKNYLKPALEEDSRADKNAQTSYILMKNSALCGDLISKDDTVSGEMDVLICLNKTPISRIKSTACINCGMCSKVCPASLIPSLLYKYDDKALFNEQAARLKTEACIECGLCDYVCPSKLALTNGIIHLKEKLAEQGLISNKEVIE